MSKRDTIIDPVNPGDFITFTPEGIRRVDDPDAPYDGMIGQCAGFSEPVVVTKDPEGSTWTARIPFRLDWPS